VPLLACKQCVPEKAAAESLLASKQWHTAMEDPIETMKRRPNDRRLAALGLLGCAVCCGCWRGAPGERPLLLVVSGDTAGWIVPCGCASNQSGGLLRRGTYVQQLRADAEVIVADVGGAPGGTSLYDQVKFEAILQGELAMGIAAHNIGAAEALLGPAYLRRMADELHAPLVSANLRDGRGEAVAEPLRIIAAAGRRVALVGVLARRYAAGDLQALPPRQAILDALRAAAGRYDAVVVLAYLPEEELQQLADTLPEADVIVGGPTGQPIPPKLSGSRLLASATHQGKFLAQFQAPALRSSQRWSGSVVELDGQFADDPVQTANLGQFYERLAALDLKPGDTSFVKALPSLRASYRIAGNAQCAKCHLDDDVAWRTSRHAHAWESLTQKGAQVDPDCQRCHATGYGMTGGFESLTRSAARVGVGCESCHGPSQAHCDNTKIPTAYRGQAKDHCHGCHDLENSPKFQYEEYWARIRHGESPAVKP